MVFPGLLCHILAMAPIPRRSALAGLAAMLGMSTSSCISPRFLWGANLKEMPSAPYGSDGCARLMEELAGIGLSEVAPVFFLWQPDPAAPLPQPGGSDPSRLGQAVRQARRAGLAPWPKAHLWIPGHWAGAARPPDPEPWLSGLSRLLLPHAEAAERNGAAGFVIGTELVGLEGSESWREVAWAVRRVFSGKLSYAAHGVEGLGRFRAWDALDEVLVSAWPPLGDDPSPAGMAPRVAAELRAVRTVAPPGRSVSLAEVGMRSKHGAQAEPWRSPEETQGPPDEALQARAIAVWDGEARKAGMARAWWWCVYSDPEAGGVRDTDFTPQGKLGWRVLEQAARSRRPDLGGRLGTPSPPPGALP